MMNSRGRGSVNPRSKSWINWTHPVTLLLLTTLISAGGWMISRVVTQRDNLRAQQESAEKQRVLAEQNKSDLRLQMENVGQGVPLVSSEHPAFHGESVVCDTARLTLVVAHNGEGKQPIMVNDIAVKVEPVSQEQASRKINCEVDTLATKPFGIVERDLYVLNVSSKGASGRFIRSARPGEAFAINPDNILQTSGEQQAITLKPGEEPIGYAVSVVAAAPGLYRVWFTADYDAKGSKSTKTESFLLAK